LRDDYERVALAGAKRLRDARGTATVGPELARALERLTAAGLAALEGDALTLHRPEHSTTALDDTTCEMMLILHAYWLRADDEATDDEVLYGELGYWQHWWNMLHARPDREQHPLLVEMVVTDDGAFAGRDWTGEFDPAIVDYVASRSLVAGRVIVPPSTLGSPAEALVDLARELGIDVRVFPSPSPFVVYDGEAIVVPDDSVAGGLERHRLTRRAALVEPLKRLFDFQWAAAVPWQTYLNGSAGILELLAEGWTDARIADAMGVSTRTVSRRIAETMAAAGVQSRFALGMKYGLTELGREAP